MYLSQNVRYQTLLNLNNAIITKGSIKSLFEALSFEMKKIFNQDRFSINIYNPNTQMLSNFSKADGVIPHELNRQERPLSHGKISQYVIDKKECLVIRSLAEYKAWPSAKAMHKAGLEATIACPLELRDIILGSMNISFKKTPDQIDNMADFFKEISGQVALAVDNMLANSKLQDMNENLKNQKNYLLQEVEENYDSDYFFYKSSIMEDIISHLEIYAETDAPVLITGETGTGKDYLARYIHKYSQRRDSMFVKISCPSLAPSLFESELFGHCKGAFTGAHSKRTGRLEMADGGTLFLDEIGELSPIIQAKLLQVLQEQIFERVGENNPVAVNFRLIAATNRRLMAGIQNNDFRSDLLYRINTLAVHVPPLRERTEDIPILIQKITEIESQKLNRNPPKYSSTVLNLLSKYPWPGNVRELKNLVKRLIILKHGSNIFPYDIEKILGLRNEEDIEQAKDATSMSLSEFESEHIQKVLKITKGKISGPHGAANLLNIPRSTLQYRIKKHNIDYNKFKHI